MAGGLISWDNISAYTRYSKNERIQKLAFGQKIQIFEVKWQFIHTNWAFYGLFRRFETQNFHDFLLFFWSPKSQFFRFISKNQISSHPNYSEYHYWIWTWLYKRFGLKCSETLNFYEFTKILGRQRVNFFQIFLKIKSVLALTIVNIISKFELDHMSSLG